MLCLPLKLAFLGLSVAFDTADSVAKHLLDIIPDERKGYPSARNNERDSKEGRNRGCKKV